MTQGDSLAMIAYGIGIFTLITNLKRVIPYLTQPWYSDDAGALDTFAILETYFDWLTRQYLGRGYHPKPPKTVLIICPENLEYGKVFGARHVFQVCTGTRCVGGYIRDDEFKRD